MSLLHDFQNGTTSDRILMVQNPLAYLCTRIFEKFLPAQPALPLQKPASPAITPPLKPYRSTSTPTPITPRPNTIYRLPI